MSLPLRTWIEKTVNEEETHWFSSKENILGAAVSKDVLIESVLIDIS